MPVLSALLAGIVFGLSAGFAPGPLLTLVIAQTLRHNVREGILAAIAPLLTDAPIILLAYLVLSRFTSLDAVMGTIALVGGLYVLYLSYETITAEPVKVESADGQPRSIVKGALVNSLNPHPYLFWATVGVPLMLKLQRSNTAAMWGFLVVFYVLLVGSKIAVAVIVGRLKTVLQRQWYRYLMRVLGLLLAVFAILLLWDASRHFGLWTESWGSFQIADVPLFRDIMEWGRNHKTILWWLLVLSIVTFVGSLILVPWLVVRLPADYFSDAKRHKTPWSDQHPVVRWMMLIVKNAAGYIFILAGIAMLALPGQGVMTIVIGIVLLDFPGKFRAERWLITRRFVLRPINWLRRRAGRGPLDLTGRGNDESTKGSDGSSADVNH